MSGLRYNDRVLILGSTGSGKSELINLMAMDLRVQRILIDTKDEFSVPDGDGGFVEPARDVEDLDWQLPILHYVPATDDVDEMQELFGALYRRRQLVAIVHELSDVCGYQAARTPPAFNSYVSKGRVRGLGIVGGSQLPVHIPVRMRTESDHVFAFVPRFLRKSDHDAIAEAMGQDPRELETMFDEVQEQLGHETPDGKLYSFLWFTRRSRKLVACPPLNEQTRSRITIVRRDDA